MKPTHKQPFPPCHRPRKPVISHQTHAKHFSTDTAGSFDGLPLLVSPNARKKPLLSQTSSSPKSKFLHQFTSSIPESPHNKDDIPITPAKRTKSTTSTLLTKSPKNHPVSSHNSHKPSKYDVSINGTDLFDAMHYSEPHTRTNMIIIQNDDSHDIPTGQSANPVDNQINDILHGMRERNYSILTDKSKPSTHHSSHYRKTLQKTLNYDKNQQSNHLGDINNQQWFKRDNSDPNANLLTIKKSTNSSKFVPSKLNQRIKQFNDTRLKEQSHNNAEKDDGVLIDDQYFDHLLSKSNTAHCGSNIPPGASQDPHNSDRFNSTTQFKLHGPKGTKGSLDVEENDYFAHYHDENIQKMKDRHRFVTKYGYTIPSVDELDSLLKMFLLGEEKFGNLSKNQRLIQSNLGIITHIFNSQLDDINNYIELQHEQSKHQNNTERNVDENENDSTIFQYTSKLKHINNPVVSQQEYNTFILKFGNKLNQNINNLFKYGHLRAVLLFIDLFRQFFNTIHWTQVLQIFIFTKNYNMGIEIFKKYILNISSHDSHQQPLHQQQSGQVLVDQQIINQLMTIYSKTHSPQYTLSFLYHIEQKQLFPTLDTLKNFLTQSTITQPEYILKSILFPRYQHNEITTGNELSTEKQDDVIKNYSYSKAIIHPHLLYSIIALYSQQYLRAQLHELVHNTLTLPQIIKEIDEINANSTGHHTPLQIDQLFSSLVKNVSKHSTRQKMTDPNRDDYQFYPLHTLLPQYLKHIVSKTVSNAPSKNQDKIKALFSSYNIRPSLDDLYLPTTNTIPNHTFLHKNGSPSTFSQLYSQYALLSPVLGTILGSLKAQGAVDVKHIAYLMRCGVTLQRSDLLLSVLQHKYKYIYRSSIPSIIYTNNLLNNNASKKSNYKLNNIYQHIVDPEDGPLYTSPTALSNPHDVVIYNNDDNWDNTFKLTNPYDYSNIIGNNHSLIPKHDLNFIVFQYYQQLHNNILSLSTLYGPLLSNLYYNLPLQSNFIRIFQRLQERPHFTHTVDYDALNLDQNVRCLPPPQDPTSDHKPMSLPKWSTKKRFVLASTAYGDAVEGFAHGTEYWNLAKQTINHLKPFKRNAHDLAHLYRRLVLPDTHSYVLNNDKDSGNSDGTANSDYLNAFRFSNGTMYNTEDFDMGRVLKYCTPDPVIILSVYNYYSKHARKINKHHITRTIVDTQLGIRQTYNIETNIDDQDYYDASIKKLNSKHRSVLNYYRKKPKIDLIPVIPSSSSPVPLTATTEATHISAMLAKFKQNLLTPQQHKEALIHTVDQILRKIKQFLDSPQNPHIAINQNTPVFSSPMVLNNMLTNYAYNNHYTLLNFILLQSFAYMANPETNQQLTITPVYKDLGDHTYKVAENDTDLSQHLFFNTPITSMLNSPLYSNNIISLVNNNNTSNNVTNPYLLQLINEQGKKGDYSDSPILPLTFTTKHLFMDSIKDNSTSTGEFTERESVSTSSGSDSDGMLPNGVLNPSTNHFFKYSLFGTNQKDVIRKYHKTLLQEQTKHLLPQQTAHDIESIDELQHISPDPLQYKYITTHHTVSPLFLPFLLQPNCAADSVTRNPDRQALLHLLASYSISKSIVTTKTKKTRFNKTTSLVKTRDVTKSVQNLLDKQEYIITPSIHQQIQLFYPRLRHDLPELGETLERAHNEHLAMLASAGIAKFTKSHPQDLSSAITAGIAKMLNNTIKKDKTVTHDVSEDTDQQHVIQSIHEKLVDHMHHISVVRPGVAVSRRLFLTLLSKVSTRQQKLLRRVLSAYNDAIANLRLKIMTKTISKQKHQQIKTNTNPKSQAFRTLQSLPSETSGGNVAGDDLGEKDLILLKNVNLNQQSQEIIKDIHKMLHPKGLSPTYNPKSAETSSTSTKNTKILEEYSFDPNEYINTLSNGPLNDAIESWKRNNIETQNELLKFVQVYKYIHHEEIVTEFTTVIFPLVLQLVKSLKLDNNVQFINTISTLCADICISNYYYNLTQSKVNHIVDSDKTSPSSKPPKKSLSSNTLAESHENEDYNSSRHDKTTSLMNDTYFQSLNLPPITAVALPSINVKSAIDSFHSHQHVTAPSTLHTKLLSLLASLRTITANTPFEIQAQLHFATQISNFFSKHGDITAALIWTTFLSHIKQQCNKSLCTSLQKQRELNRLGPSTTNKSLAKHTNAADDDDGFSAHLAVGADDYDHNSPTVFVNKLKLAGTIQELLDIQSDTIFTASQSTMTHNNTIRMKNNPNYLGDGGDSAGYKHLADNSHSTNHSPQALSQLQLPRGFFPNSLLSTKYNSQIKTYYNTLATYHKQQITMHHTNAHETKEDSAEISKVLYTDDGVYLPTSLNDSFWPPNIPKINTLSAIFELITENADDHINVLQSFLLETHGQYQHHQKQQRKIKINTDDAENKQQTTISNKSLQQAIRSFQHTLLSSESNTPFNKLMASVTYIDSLYIIFKTLTHSNLTTFSPDLLSILHSSHKISPKLTNTPEFSANCNKIAHIVNNNLSNIRSSYYLFWHLLSCYEQKQLQHQIGIDVGIIHPTTPSADVDNIDAHTPSKTYINTEYNSALHASYEQLLSQPTIYDVNDSFCHLFINATKLSALPQHFPFHMNQHTLEEDVYAQLQQSLSHRDALLSYTDDLVHDLIHLWSQQGLFDELGAKKPNMTLYTDLLTFQKHTIAPDDSEGHKTFHVTPQGCDVNTNTAIFSPTKQYGPLTMITPTPQILAALNSYIHERIKYQYNLQSDPTAHPVTLNQIKSLVSPEDTNKISLNTFSLLHHSVKSYITQHSPTPLNHLEKIRQLKNDEVSTAFVQVFENVGSVDDHNLNPQQHELILSTYNNTLTSELNHQVISPALKVDQQGKSMLVNDGQYVFLPSSNESMELDLLFEHLHGLSSKPTSFINNSANEDAQLQYQNNVNDALSVLNKPMYSFPSRIALSSTPKIVVSTSAPTTTEKQSRKWFPSRQELLLTSTSSDISTIQIKYDDNMNITIDSHSSIHESLHTTLLIKSILQSFIAKFQYELDTIETETEDHSDHSDHQEIATRKAYYQHILLSHSRKLTQIDAFLKKLSNKQHVSQYHQNNHSILSTIEQFSNKIAQQTLSSSTEALDDTNTKSYQIQYYDTTLTNDIAQDKSNKGARIQSLTYSDYSNVLVSSFKYGLQEHANCHVERSKTQEPNLDHFNEQLFLLYPNRPLTNDEGNDMSSILSQLGTL